MERISEMVSDNPVVIFSKSSCWVSHSIKSLLYGLGANLTVYDLDLITGGYEIEQALRPLGHSPTVPAVFIGGDFAGGAKEIVTLHVNGSLISKL
ncbi:hypothetical protein ABFS82_14G010300 [Erythranthe guttata]|uniref:Glutaredoxin domain-containing protein n=1 Tax=Erythranthe guttata TaxID=4155 RepID=A0A022S2R1_ERYGU|nr:hypothetical protein MIMGU_mgv1a024526mg [Erythranthe guttata]